MEVKVGEKTFRLRELLATEVDDIDFEDKKGAIKKQVMLSASLSDAEYNTLTLKERLALLKAISELNGLNDFTIQSK